MKTSRLLKEKSPYLRQHADNEVDWYPWGEEAFSKARRENKPIFLSIGYSTCHWCHVMERESFMDPVVGDYLNQHFVPVKVDRETRPDVDQFYMTFVVQTTGSGGWPMSVWLTPEGEPFLGGTYFPQPARYGRASFLEVLKRVQQAWSERREEMTSHAQEVTRELAEMTRGEKQEKLVDKELLSRAVAGWRDKFDKTHGGFGAAPKFPQPATLEFLLRFGATRADSEAEEMTYTTLEAMALGGIRDHLEGGFHRYSTDKLWRVPHFEKMLYDQGLLLQVYCDAYAATGNELFKEAAESTIFYLNTRLKAPGGGYYSAEDADSVIPGSSEEGEDHAEGAFYVWTEGEFKAALTPEEFKVAAPLLGVLAGGNAEQDPSGELKDKNVLYLSQAPTDSSSLAPIFTKLAQARSERPRPLRDEKILTAWNAMVVVALARAGRTLERPEYTRQAVETIAFLEKNLQQSGWQRSYLEGAAEVPAFANDFANLVAAYLELYQTLGEAEYLLSAVRTQEQLDELFWDQELGGYFETRADTELSFRHKEKHDGATWSTNSRASLNLVLLHQLTGREQYRERAEQLFVAARPELTGLTQSLPGMLSALDLYYSGHQSVVVAGDLPQWWQRVNRGYHPHRTALWLKDEETRARLMPVVEHLGSLPLEPAAYICEDFQCGLPIKDLDRLEQALEPSEK